MHTCWSKLLLSLLPYAGRLACHLVVSVWWSGVLEVCVGMSLNEDTSPRMHQFQVTLWGPMMGLAADMCDTAGTECVAGKIF